MTLDEAIRHCEDVANDRCGCAEDCVSEHRQLAEWLKELQSIVHCGECKWWSERDKVCLNNNTMPWVADDYCSCGERSEDE